MRNRLFLSTLTLTIAATAAAVLPVTSAEAATNGLTIRTVTKNVVQGDTARIKGKIIGGKAGQSLTIQQRSPQKGKDWGSGRQVKTDKDGKWTLDRVIKGKFTRDYRACIGAPGRRQCSLRARIEVVPRVVGLTVQQFPATVEPNQAMTVTGTTDSTIAGRVVYLEQLNPTSLKFAVIGQAASTAAGTFQVTGTPVVSGKASTFRVSANPFSGRTQKTLSRRFATTVYTSVPLSSLPAVQGGYQTGSPTQQGPTGELRTFTNAVSPTASNTFAVNLDASCSRFTAEVFLANTAADADTMNTSVVTTTNGAAADQFRSVGIQKGQPTRPVNVSVAGAQVLTVTQNPGNGPDNVDPVWYGNATLTCAF